MAHIPFLAVLSLLFFPLSARALVVSETHLTAEMDSSILVAEITGVGLVSRPLTDGSPGFLADVQLDRILRIRDDGSWFPSVGEEFQISGVGGELGETGLMVSGFPKPRPGVSYSVYLKRVAEREFSIVGFDAGLRNLNSTARHFSRNRTDGSNGSGNGPFLYWEQAAFPLPYAIAWPSFLAHPDFIAAIDLSFKSWRDVTETKIEFLPLGCSTSLRNENDGVNNIVLINSNWPFGQTAIAVTRNFYVAGSNAKAGMILDSDILLNGVDYEFTTTNEAGKHDIQNIITHEVGHFAGLGHEITRAGNPIDSDATMYENASPNQTNKRTLKGNDIDGIRSAYGGTGQKIEPVIPSCAFSDRAASCGVNRNAKAGWMGPAAWLFVLASTLLLGRSPLFGRGQITSIAADSAHDSSAK